MIKNIDRQPNETKFLNICIRFLIKCKISYNKDILIIRFLMEPYLILC